MSFRDPYTFYNVTDLKDLLSIHGLPTSGTKAELIARLDGYDLLGKRRSVVCNCEGRRKYNVPTIMATESKGVVRRTSNPSTAAKKGVESRHCELDRLRQENALMQQEVEVMKRELALERSMQCSKATTPVKKKTQLIELPGPSIQSEIGRLSDNWFNFKNYPKPMTTTLRISPTPDNTIPPHRSLSYCFDPIMDD